MRCGAIGYEVIQRLDVNWPAKCGIISTRNHMKGEKWKPQKWIHDGAQLITSDIWIVMLCYKMARISYFVEPKHLSKDDVHGHVIIILIPSSQ